uniref:Uncharacterized protein n=1 Tax=uncultured Acetothermia bacterium TaxID=236499 RepID=H5S8X0_9BACT|nr:hypothetical protein HGMM_F01H03C08 [uncultured Acetothermia bacterium]
MNADEAQAVQLVGGQQLLIPFGEDAHLVWTRANGQTAAVGLIRQGNKTLNVSVDGQERVVRSLPAQKAEKLLRKLREKSKFQEFEGKLAQRGKRVGKVRVLFDETNQIAILGIASEGNAEKIAHQVRIKVKADKEDEPEDGAEPAIQATACGQASGEAVPEGVKMQPFYVPPGDGGSFEGGYEGPQICTSQWGYDYLCISRTPMISLSTTSLTVPQTFINQQTQASFVIWNSGGGRLTGTVSVPAPFSIVSGASFSLLPGQPQEVVVKFSSATPGSFSKSISISSNAGSKTVSATSVAHKVSFSPATLDFGSGLLVLREQCNKMGTCGLGTEKVGLPIEKQLTVKNEGSVSVTLTLSTSAPYKIVSVLPTLSPGQSAQVTVRFDPSESGSFTGSVQVGINGGQGNVTSSPLVGVAHKIEIEPAELNFGIVIVGTVRERKLTVKNQGVTMVALAMSTAAPFSIGSEGSFTLAPSESQDVTVRVSPTASGDLQGTVRLTTEAAFKELPVLGKAYTEEEYREILKQSILATCQATEASQGARNTYFVPGLNQDFLFYHMPCPTDEELDALFEFLMALEDQPPPDDDISSIVLEQLKDPQVRASLLAALQTLANMAKEGKTADELLDKLNELLDSDPNLQKFFQELTKTTPAIRQIGQMLSSLSTVLRAIAAATSPTGAPSIGFLIVSVGLRLLSMPAPPGLLAGDQGLAQQFIIFLGLIEAGFSNGQSAIEAVINSGHSESSRMDALITIAFTGMVAAGISVAAELTSTIRNAGLTMPLFNEFLKWIENAYKGNSLISPALVARYMGYLSNLALMFSQQDPPWERFANAIGGFIAFAALSQDGWTVHGGTGWYGFQEQVDVQVVATKQIEGRWVTVFIHVEAKLGVDEVARVARTIEDITRVAARWSNGSSEVDASTRVTVLIAFNVEPGAVDQLVATLQDKNLQTPVIILYPENGQWTARCVGDCSDKQFLDAVAAALAQALGTPYSGGSENALGQMLNILDQAMAAAEYFYGYGNPAMAWHLAFGICGNDMGCILFLAEALIREAQEECGNQPCPRPMSSPVLTERLNRKGGR